MADIKFGDNNADVLNLQQKLNKLFFCIDEDSDFGNQTLTAVKEFQKRNSMPDTGIVNDITYNAIIVDIDYKIDKSSIEKISKLHPKIRSEVFHLVKQCYKNNVRIRVAQGYRTFAEQDELYAQGRTKPGPIVTNSKAGWSNHNYSLAIDFCLLHTDGTISWSLLDDADADGQKDWMEVVTIFKNAGYSWGGNWNFVDNPHIEKLFGHTIRELLKLHDDGKVDKDGYVII